jgi:hypothetical protein
MKKLIFLFLVQFIISSCEKMTEWQLHGPNKDLIVVEGIIVDEQKTQTIKISHSVNELNEIPQPVSGASVIIFDEDSAYILTEQSANPGYYDTKNYFIARVGKHFTLRVDYNNKIYSAKTYMMQSYQFKQLKYAKNTDNDLYHIIWVAYPYNTEKPAMWEILLDWSHVSGYDPADSAKNRARLIYYTLSTIDVNELFAPRTETVSFPSGTIITERRYSLTPEHVEYFRALLSETNWKGGLFDSTPANTPTNMSEGAVGFFGACSVTNISLTVN